MNKTTSASDDELGLFKYVLKIAFKICVLT